MNDGLRGEIVRKIMGKALKSIAVGYFAGKLINRCG